MANAPMKVLAEWSYEPAKIHHGYSKETLYIGLGNKDGNYKFEKRPVSEDMIEKFTGGRGFGLKLLWDAVTENTKWDDPENEIVIAGGPFCGITQYPGTGKCYSVFLSPATKQTYNSNAGGYFAPFLKFAGFDALELQGKADRPVVIFIDGDNYKITVYESTLEDPNAYAVSEDLHEYFAKDEADKRTISVISTGMAARTSYWCGMNFSFYDVRRKAVRLKQAGRGGGGTVLWDKNVRALVVKRTHFTGLENDPVDVKVIQRCGASIHKRVHDLDDKQSKMRSVGTAHLMEIMDAYDLLPVNNYKFGRHKDIDNVSSDAYKKLFTQGMADGCWYGCSMACAKAVDHFPLQTGPWKGREVIVDGPEYETAAGLGSNLGIFDPYWTIEANFYADAKQEGESDSEVMERFNKLVTVSKATEPTAMSYQEEIKGRVQDREMRVEPVAMFILTPFDGHTELRPASNYIRELGDYNSARYAPWKLYLGTLTSSQSDREDIEKMFDMANFFTSAIQKAGTLPRPADYFNRAVAMGVLKDFDASIADFDSTLNLAPDMTLAYLGRAGSLTQRAYMVRQQHDENTDEAKGQMNLAAVRHDLQMAIVDLDKALELSPRLVYAWFNKGNIYYSLGDYTSALECYNRALELRSDFPEAYYNRGLTYLSLGNRESGRADLSRAGELGILPSYSLLKRI